MRHAAIIETKLHVPSIRTGTIARHRLREQMGRGAEAPLTLVSAPAGFGKSTLLAQWIADTRTDAARFAWVSLDVRDNDARTFWTYVATATRAAASGVGSEALGLLDTPAGSLEAIAASLINDLDTVAGTMTLVLDDYHVIDSAEVHDSLAFFVAHLPASTHLVLATRSDPPLPLAQLRARRELVEIRVADLRFTPGEAEQYLNDAMGLNVREDDVAVLETRTEGWIAALQLAALSIQGRDDGSAFIASFAGDDRYIVDYLAEEVLQLQTPDIRDFLLRTSVLDRLTGPLCDAVTGQPGGRSRLVALDRANLFLVPLDDRRQWYRYHHLFADVLRAHLADEHPGLAPELHRAASEWFEGSGDTPDAIRHALDASDPERAARLIELVAPAMQQQRQEIALRDWIAALPDSVVRVRPVLSNVYAGALLSTGQFDRVDVPLTDAEQFAAALADDRPAADLPAPVVADAEQLRHLPAATAVHRAGFRLVTGDLDGAVHAARRALGLATPDDHLVRAASTALIGLATWSTGNLVDAEQAYRDCLVDMAKAGHFADILGCSIALADIQITLGLLDHAHATYTSAVRLATGQSTGPLRGTSDMLTGLAEAHLERGEVDAAADYVSRARQLGDRLGLPQFPYRRRVVEARIREAAGDIDDAIDLLVEGLAVFTTDFSPNVHPLPAQIARLHLRAGRRREAEAWTRETPISTADELTYVHEFEHTVLARVLLARHAAGDAGALTDALDLLARLEQAARDGQRTASLIEILVVTAIARHANGATAEALGAIADALELAQPQRYVRVFRDDGHALAPLLAALPPRPETASFLADVLADVGSPPPDRGGADPRTAAAALVDPLSARELDVVRLLATDLDGPDIARQMFISLNTMRTHTRSIYTKLGVTSRRAAVRRAHELELI